MYIYDDIDQRLVDERVAQFRDQTRRFLAGKLSEDEFRALRLRNGLYIQRYAPMLRVAIPYGLLSSRQLRKLAHIARTYDRGYGHFSTRQNLQFNWPKLEDVPDILAELATVQMHAIQTSGNCVRNITTDHFAGVAQRRDRRFLRLVRGDPPVVDLPPRIQPTCRASSRSPSTALAPTAPRPRCTTSACTPCAMRKAKSGFACWSAAAWAARRSSAT